MNSISIVRVTSIPRARRFRCDRKTALGNPHVMRNESLEERDRVCDAFAKDAAAGFNPQQLAALRTIWRAWQKEDIELACHCAPLRCHCETLREFLVAHAR